jgi:hypothetical protein
MTTESEHAKMLGEALERQRAEIDRRDRIIGWMLERTGSLTVPVAHVYRIERPYIVRETGEGTERMLTLELEDPND